MWHNVILGSLYQDQPNKYNFLRIFFFVLLFFLIATKHVLEESHISRQGKEYMKVVKKETFVQLTTK